MSLITLPFPMLWGPVAGAFPTSGLGTAAGATNSVVFNGAGDGLAFVFSASSSTPPDSVSFHVGTVTAAGTTGTVDCTLETVDATTGAPSGTLVTNSNTSSITVTTTGVKTASGIAGTASLTRGQPYAIVIRAGTGWNRDITLRRSYGTSAQAALPYSVTNTSAAWAVAPTSNTGHACGLAVSGGTKLIMPGFCGPITNWAAQTFSDATNPDERGNRFSLPFAATICGAQFLVYNGGATGNDDYAVSLYSSHTGTPVQLATAALEGAATADVFTRAVYFGADVDVTANTVYALAFKACGSDSQSFLRWDFAAAADTAWLAGSNVYSTSRDGGTGAPSGSNSFTDLTTSVYAIFPLLSRVDDGAGSGGGGSVLGGPFT